MNRMRLIGLISLFFCFVAGTAWGQVKMPETSVVEAWGEASLTDSPAADRQRAVAHAQRNALEQVVGVYVTSSTLVRNAKLVEDKVYTHADGFINDYKVIKKERKEVQRVKIRAHISLLPVADVLKKSGLLRKWRVGVLIAPEGRQLSVLLRYYSRARIMEVAQNVETAVGRAIGEAGFKLVDPRHLQKLRKAADPSAAVSPELAGNMDLLVTGSISMAVRNTTGAIKQAICQIHLKALRVDTGEIIYQENVGNSFDNLGLQVSQELAEKYMDSHGNGQMSDGTPDLRTYGHGSSAALDKSLQLASVLSADSVVSQIMRIPAATRSMVVVEVHNVEFDDLMTLEEHLSQVEGVAAANSEGFGEGAKSIEVEYTGKAMNLARMLSKSKVLKGMGLKVKGVTQNKIVLKK